MDEKTEDLIKLLESLGKTPEEIENIIKYRRHGEKSKNEENLRSWISVGISFLALLISIIAILK